MIHNITFFEKIMQFILLLQSFYLSFKLLFDEFMVNAVDL